MLLYRRAGFSLASTAVVIAHQSFLVIWIFNFYIIINIFFLYLTHSLYSNEPQSQSLCLRFSHSVPFLFWDHRSQSLKETMRPIRVSFCLNRQDNGGLGDTAQQGQVGLKISPLLWDLCPTASPCTLYVIGTPVLMLPESVYFFPSL